ncbi:MAG: glycosyltransferase family 2 protein [Bacteroidia bacterium]
MPKLTIITVNYNNKTGLDKTIRSIVQQTYSDFEYIIIDGGSDDGSTDIIRQYKDKINFWVSEKDSGIYNAMNKGIALANGEYCLFLNSGDSLFEKDTLEKVFNKTNYTEDIIYGNMLIDFSGKQVLGKMPEKITFEQMMADTLWHPVSFIKRKLFNTYGNYREDLKIVSDYDFFIKTILINKVSALHIPITVCVFPVDGISSQSSNANLIKAEREKVQLAYFSKDVIDQYYKTGKKAKKSAWNKVIGLFSKNNQEYP